MSEANLKTLEALEAHSAAILDVLRDKLEHAVEARIEKRDREAANHRSCTLMCNEIAEGLARMGFESVPTKVKRPLAAHYRFQVCVDRMLELLVQEGRFSVHLVDTESQEVIESTTCDDCLALADLTHDEFNEDMSFPNQLAKILLLAYERCETELVDAALRDVDEAVESDEEPTETLEDAMNGDENPLWLDDEVQFSRLISELEANGAFTEDVMMDLCMSMDLPKSQVCKLIDRAQFNFEDHKRKYVQ